MSLYNVPNISEGIDEALIDIASAETSFIPMFLLFVFMVVFIGGISAQRNRAGRSDYPLWASISSISTLMIALLFTLASGLIQLPTLIIVVVITIFSGLWLFLDRSRFEI